MVNWVELLKWANFLDLFYMKVGAHYFFSGYIS